MKYLIVLGSLYIAGCGSYSHQDIPGSNGAQGNPGQTGSIGATGASGSSCDVVQNPTGAEISCEDGSSAFVSNGLPGSNCSVSNIAVGNVIAPNGGSLISCAGSSAVVLNGAKGNNGSKGTNGSNGSNGSNGVNGSNGTNGTVIVPENFCPGFVQSYPNTFAESGLCIAGQLYGVYSANDGFLALLPPGTYSSVGINASCTVTIGPNCKIN